MMILERSFYCMDCFVIILQVVRFCMISVLVVTKPSWSDGGIIIIIMTRTLSYVDIFEDHSLFTFPGRYHKWDNLIDY